MSKIKDLYDSINRFSFAQMTSNTDGKTSGSGTMGALTVGVGLVTFLAGTVDFIVTDRSDIMTQSLVVIGVGVGLLGYRKSQGKSAAVSVESADNQVEDTQLNS